MKQLYKFIILILISLKSYSQTQAIIYFKDGDSIEGFASLKFNKIKFKVSQDDKSDSWDEEYVKKITFLDFGATRTFEYVKLNSLDKPKLVEIITKGEATLYKKVGSDFSLTDMIYNPYDDRPDNTLSPTLKTQLGPQAQQHLSNSNVSETSTFYYIKKAKDKYPTCLNCGVINAWRKKHFQIFR